MYVETSCVEIVRDKSLIAHSPHVLHFNCFVIGPWLLDAVQQRRTAAERDLLYLVSGSHRILFSQLTLNFGFMRHIELPMGLRTEEKTSNLCPY